MADPKLLIAVASTVIALVSTAAVANAANTAKARPARQAIADSSLALRIVSAVNGLRAENGLVGLSTSTALTSTAANHSTSMGLRGYFSHESADGSAFWKRLTRVYKPAKFQSWSVGENLLWSASSISPAGAISLWMASPEHRAVLLAPQWREIGLSVVHVPAAEGVFGGQDVAIVTADFGVRKP